MKDCLVMKSPASWHRDMYREGAPTGNGKIGALVYGGIAKETVVVNHSNLWSLGKVSELPDIHESLEKTRELMDQGDYFNANWISANALREQGYAPKLGTPCSVCDLCLEMKEREPFKKYRRTIHMDTGEVSVTWYEGDTYYERNLFVSRSKEYIFYEIKSSKRLMSMDIWLDLHETYEDDSKKKRKNLIDLNEISSTSYDNKIGFYGLHEDGTYFGAFGKIVTDGTIKPLSNGKLSIEKAQSVFVVIHPFVNEKKEFAIDSQTRLQEEYHYDLEKEEHRRLHEKLYRSVEIDFYTENNKTNEELLDLAYDEVSPVELLEKQWKYGRYLMICGTAKEGLPFPLYGLWHGRYSMPWPHNMANENVQMIYWHTLSGGLSYSVKTLIQYYVERIEHFKECAKKVFGLPGIYIPAGTTPGNCMPNQIVPVIINWIGCAGWLSQHFYDYYRYTKDEETLLHDILPFMIEAALFYENYLVKEADGTYKIYPSVSPENTPENLIPKDNEDMAHPCPSVMNATMDIAIIKELMNHLVYLSNTRGIYQDKVSTWMDIITHLPQYETTEEGDIKEWIHKDFKARYNHRHLSHIYPVFPGREVVKKREKDELLDAFKLAVDKRILGAQTGWSLAHMACIYARFENGDQALSCLDILNKSCLLNNLFTLHNDYRGMGLTLGRGSFAPVQLDALMGCVAAIQEMLLYAGEDFIKLLPALPTRLNKGKIKNIRYNNGTISMEWNRREHKFNGEICAKHDTVVQLFLPDFITKTKSNIKSGDKIKISAGDTLYL